MQPTIHLEVCIDSVESGLAAQHGGAHRLELCDNLIEGGTTPSVGMIRFARRLIDLDIYVMIRPPGGDFCYSDIEYDVMKTDIQIAKNEGAHGVVIGILREDGKIDHHRIEALIDLARPLGVTFHRAFDMTSDPVEALDTLITLGVDRVLTSGLEPSALEGVDVISDLVQQAEGRIRIMAGGGITERNIGTIIRQSGVTEVHASGSVFTESRMTFRNPRVFMGREFRAPEFGTKITDEQRIRSILKTIDATK